MTGATYLPARRLAVGGMAEVLLARQQGLAGFERLVVIKRVRPQLKSDKRFVEMFLNEGRLAAQLRHPNIVEIHDVVREDDEFYIVMEYVSGEDLRIVVRETAEQKQAIPVAIACQIAADAAHALDYAHNATDLEGNPLGVIHRDVSPSNILVTYAGGTKLVDFGLANANIHNIYTKPGTLKGKYAYSSPELVRHEEPDARSDVFSLGVVLHELLTFRRLFRGKNPNEVVKAVMEGEIPPPSRFNEEVSPELDRVVLGALERDREQRTSSAAAFVEELEGAVRGMGISVGPHDVAQWMERTLAQQHERRTRFEREVAAADLSEDGSQAELAPAFGSVNDSSPGALTPFPSSSEVSSPAEPVATTEGSKGMALKVGVGVLLALAVLGVAFWAGFRQVGGGAAPGGPPAETASGARPEEAGFRLQVHPEGARVVADGRVVTEAAGSEPVLVPAAPGSQVELQVIEGGYESHFETLTAPAKGSTEELAVSLSPLAPDDAGPDRAEVVVAEPSEPDAGEQDEASGEPRTASARSRARRTRQRAAARRRAAAGDDGDEATLVVAYRPEEAVLTVDGAVRSGGSPRRIEGIPAGEHRVRLEAPGYASLDRRVEVPAGEVSRLDFELTEKAPDKARVDVITVPAGAQITVDGRPRGTSPVVGLSLTVEEAHRVSAELDGYETWRTRLVPEPGDNPPLVATLEAEPRETATASAEPEPQRDIRVPLSMSGSASAGRHAFRSGCGKCHGRSASQVSPDRYTQAAWSRYFATGRHTRRAAFRPHFSRSQLADVKAYLMANAADVESDVAAGVR